MAEINYLKSFSGSERQFAESFQGLNYAHNAPIQLYLKGYSKAYEKTYTGIYIKQYTKEYINQYSKEYEGTYNKEYIGLYNKQYSKDYIKTYLGEYEKHWTKTYIGQYEGTFEGTFNKAYEGFFNKVYEGQFTGNQEYNGNTFGQFEGVFGKAYSGLFARSGSPYIKTYVGQYTKEYTGQYEGQFTKQYSGVYEGTFDKTYIGHYQSTYTREFVRSRSSNIGTVRTVAEVYSRQFEKVWTHTYIGAYEKTYLGQYTKQYQGVYTKTYIGQYTQTYLGSYTKEYARLFQAIYHKEYNKQYTKEYEKIYIGLYQKTYTGQYTKNWLPNPGSYERTSAGPSYTGAGPIGRVYLDSDGAFLDEWTGTWQGPGFEFYQGPTYSSSFGAPTFTNYVLTPTSYSGQEGPGLPGYPPITMNYVEGPTTRLQVFPYGVQYARGEGLGSYEGGYSVVSFGTYSRAFQGLWQSIYVGGQFAGPLGFEKTYVGPSYLGPGLKEQNYSHGPYESGPPSPFPDPAGPDTVYYEGAPDEYYTGNYTKNYIVGPYNRTYEGTFIANYIHYRPVQYLKQYTKTYIKEYEKHWERIFTKQYEGGFDKQYEGAFNKDYSGLFSKQYEGFFNKTYLGHYTKSYIKLYEGIRNSTITFLGSYIGFFDGLSYTGHFSGPIYLGNYTKSYTGLYEGQFSKQYSGVYEGTFSKQYEGSYTRNYVKQWSGTYIKGYSGVYQGGPYNTQYTGAYTKTYLGIYTKSYLGQYSRQFEGAFNKQYSALYEGAFNKTYTKQYTKTYIGNYTRSYTGIYIQQYEAGYIKQYSKEYEGTFTKQYVRTYGGAWSGAGPVYLGLGYFTNYYTGERTFHQTYAGTTDVQNPASGNMTNNIRVKVGDAWKDVSRIRIKEDGQWKIVQVSRVKQPNGEWAAVGIDHERVTINVTSNTANFNLGTELANLGLSLYDKPKHVNINIANNTFIYSSNTTPALDTSLLTGSQGALHKVKILLGTGGGIIGKGGDRGVVGATNVIPASSQNGGNGGDAILLRDGVSLFVESYGTIAGGGGGGGAGGILTAGHSSLVPNSNGGRGAGWHSSLGYVTESSSNRNGTDATTKYITHGGDGGLLGQLGIAAGGFNADDSSNNEANPGTNFAQYAGSGNGGLPGSAIKGYDASRVTFINSTESSVWGDSAFKFKA